MTETFRTIQSFDVLGQLMADARGWRVNVGRSCKTANRQTFRLWFEPDGNGNLALAMFITPPTQIPTLKNVNKAILTAVADAGYGTGADVKLNELHFSLLLLYDDAPLSIRRDVAALLDQLSAESNGNFVVELWHVKNLQYNVLRCADVPKHTRLDKDAISRLPCPPSKLPYILISDPIVHALGARIGDVLHVLRVDSRFGEIPYWRLVVDDSAVFK